MNRVGAGTTGYTVVESMMFLAVSASMILLAMLFLGGQQRKNEFAVGIREIESQMIDIMNDVSTGFYNDTLKFNCAVTVENTSGKPLLTDLNAEDKPNQGINSECTFVGRAIQFAPDSDFNSFVVHPLVGRRQIGAGSKATDVRTVAQANPAIFGSAGVIRKLPYGIQVRSITYGAGLKSGSIAFVSEFAGNSGSGGITGTQDISLIAIKNTTLPQPKTTAESTIISQIVPSSIDENTFNPDSGIKICFDSGGTNQHAVLLLGGPDRQFSTNLTIGSEKCPTV